MLPPSLRWLVCRRVLSVPLRLQRHISLNSVENKPPQSTQSSKKCPKKQQPKRRKKRSQSQSRSAQSGRPLEGKEKKRVKRPQSPPTNWVPMTREEKILKTVWVASCAKKSPTPVVLNWPREVWKTDDWGLDSESPVFHLGSSEQADHNETRTGLKPPPSDLVEKSGSSKSGFGESESRSRGPARKIGDVGHTRRLEGIFTPLSSPTLQGASLSVHPAFLHAHGFYRRGSLDGTPSGRDFVP